MRELYTYCILKSDYFNPINCYLNQLSCLLKPSTYKRLRLTMITLGANGFFIYRVVLFHSKDIVAHHVWKYHFYLI
jgi:hypothetical protein